MHKSRLGALVIDCQQPDDLMAMARFWADALGYTIAERQSDDPLYVMLEGPDGELKVIIQRVDHPSRVHLDIEADDKAAEVARLEKLGAQKIADVKRWTVLEAPSGHRFCVVDPQRPDFAEGAKGWD
jgi:hypothetical protein